MTHRIVRTIDRPSAAELAPFAAARAGSIGRFVKGIGVMDAAIQAIRKPWSLVGPAITVLLDDPDSLMAMQAMELAQPGDVIVVAAQARMEVPCWGGGMTLTAKARGLAGAVIDGEVGDTFTILEHDVPIFARGSSPRFDLDWAPGSINVPVTCGGVLVYPGDVVIANADGVVVVPRPRLAAVAAAMEAHQAQLRVWGDRIRAGASMFEAAGLDAVIADLGIAWEDGPAPIRTA